MACWGRRVKAGDIQDEGSHISGHDAEQDGDQLDPALAQQGGENGGDQSHPGNDHGSGVGHEPCGTVAGAPHGHVDRHRCQDQADDHDDRAGDHGRQHAAEHIGTVNADELAEDHVENARAEQAAHGGRDAPGLHAVMMGAMKAKLDARNTGTLPLVMTWNSRVPAPAVNRATLASSPVSSGTRTSAPNATNSICAPSSASFGLKLYS